MVHVSERTLQRYADDEKLSADTSERAILLSQLYQRGTEVFGQLENFTGMDGELRYLPSTIKPLFRC